MEEVSQAVVLRLDGQTKIAPSPSDSERKRSRRVRMQGPEGVSHSDGRRLTLLDDLASSRRRLPGLG